MFSAEILSQYHACQEVDYSENIFKNSISAPFKSILRLNGHSLFVAHCKLTQTYKLLFSKLLITLCHTNLCCFKLLVPKNTRLLNPLVLKLTHRISILLLIAITTCYLLKKLLVNLCNLLKSHCCTMRKKIKRKFFSYIFLNLLKFTKWCFLL